MITSSFDPASEAIISPASIFGEQKHFCDTAIATFSREIYPAVLERYPNEQIAEISAVNRIKPVHLLTLDENMNVTALDVRDIDPDYNGCEADIYLAPNGCPWVFLYNREHPDTICPAAVPFFLLDRSRNDYGLQID